MFKIRVESTGQVFDARDCTIIAEWSDDKVQDLNVGDLLIEEDIANIMHEFEE